MAREKQAGERTESLWLCFTSPQMLRQKNCAPPPSNFRASRDIFVASELLDVVPSNTAVAHEVVKLYPVTRMRSSMCSTGNPSFFDQRNQLSTLSLI